MTLKEAIQKDVQRHLYVQSAITSGQPNNTLFMFRYSSYTMIYYL